MNDRGMKKWRPFNSVVSSRTLLERDECEKPPILSEDEIKEFEEILKSSMYTHSKVKITFIENGKENEIIDYVLSFDSINKNIILKSQKINFRQIKRIEN